MHVNTRQAFLPKSGDSTMAFSPILQKETREIAPYLAGAILVVTLIAWTFTRPSELPIVPLRIFCIAVFYILVQLLGVSPVASEFTHGTMARLLGQPVDRNRLWFQKFGTSSLALGGVLLAALVAAVVLSFINLGLDKKTLLRDCTVILLPTLANALTTGPFMAIHLRQTLTALLATSITPFLVVFAVLAVGAIVETLTGFDLFKPAYDVWNVPSVYILAGAAWMVISYSLAHRRFLKLEV